MTAEDTKRGLECSKCGLLEDEHRAGVQARSSSPRGGWNPSCSGFDPEPSEEAKQLRALEEVADYLDVLVAAVAVRHGVVGIRQLVVSEELGRRLGPTPEAPASVRTQCGLVRVVAEPAREKVDANSPHAFVRGKFERGERGGQWPEETCDVCGRDPRNAIHKAKP